MRSAVRHRSVALSRLGRRRCSTLATLYYQDVGVPCSLTSTGLVGTDRDAAGSDGEFFGVSPAPTEVTISDGRARRFSLDENGFCRVDHAWRHVDYYDNHAILREYYPECERLVRQDTGASRVLAFDHNLRSRRHKAASDMLKGGNAVQEPLTTYGIHNDYTLTSSARRVEQLARPPSTNDTLRGVFGASAPLDPAELDRLLRGRWQFINVWRNVSTAPVESVPLALCDAASVGVDELIVFEIRYVDRTGENYFVSARNRRAHAWYYFPKLTRDEAVLIKCWDSRGRDFVGMAEAARGLPPPPPSAPTVPATFSLHSGFDDPQTPPGAPERESIEVRLVAFFDE